MFVPPLRVTVSYPMAKLSKDKLAALKSAFIDDAMSPGDAAKKVGVSSETEVRYYELWDGEIRKEREQQLVPQMLESMKRLGKKNRKSG
jgi:hypothetical protein